MAISPDEPTLAELAYPTCLSMARQFYDVSAAGLRNIIELSGYSADMVAALVVAFGVMYQNTSTYLKVEETKNKGNGLRCRKV